MANYTSAATRSRATLRRSSLPKLAEVLLGVGRPIAFYPALIPFLGSINATILFCQLYYWQGRSKHVYVYKNSYDLRGETGLTYAQQKKARSELIARGILLEHHARLQHEMRFQIDLENLPKLWLEYSRSSSKKAA